MTDEEAIRRVIAEYCQLYDDRNWDALAGIFTDDASFRVRDIEVEGGKKIVEFLGQMPAQRGIHGSFNPLIDVDGDTARAAVDYLWFGDIEGTLTIGSGGRYLKRLVRQPDRWRIAELEIRLLLDPA